MAWGQADGEVIDLTLMQQIFTGHSVPDTEDRIRANLDSAGMFSK